MPPRACCRSCPRRWPARRPYIAGLRWHPARPSSLIITCQALALLEHSGLTTSKANGCDHSGPPLPNFVPVPSPPWCLSRAPRCRPWWKRSRAGPPWRRSSSCSRPASCCGGISSRHCAACRGRSWPSSRGCGISTGFSRETRTSRWWRCTTDTVRAFPCLLSSAFVRRFSLFFPSLSLSLLTPAGPTRSLRPRCARRGQRQPPRRRAQAVAGAPGQGLLVRRHRHPRLALCVAHVYCGSPRQDGTVQGAVAWLCPM